MALAAESLRPAVGEKVELTATWAGPWPAAVEWAGVDGSAGTTAWLEPTVEGSVVVRAGAVELTIDVQPTRSVGTEVRENRSRPFPGMGGCLDLRFPALAGEWVVGCGTGGLVRRALSLATGAEATLEGPPRAPGLAPGLAVAVGGVNGLWRLAAGAVTPERTIPNPGVTAPATDGALLAAGMADHVEAWAVGERVRRHLPARPLPGYPLAVAERHVAWVERDALTGEDVWIRTPAGQAVPLARTPTQERHVVGSGRWLAWVSGRDVLVEDLQSHERRRYDADAGALSGPSLWGPVACWEDRARVRAGTADTDVRCSDGLEIVAAGEQRFPYRWGPWLLYREDGQARVATATSLLLDDDDPRASGGRTVPGGYRGAHREGAVTYAFEWPAPDWIVERWNGEDWGPAEPLPLGEVRVENPSGDAIRLRPAP